MLRHETGVEELSKNLVKSVNFGRLKEQLKTFVEKGTFAADVLDRRVKAYVNSVMENLNTELRSRVLPPGWTSLF